MYRTYYGARRCGLPAVASLLRDSSGTCAEASPLSARPVCSACSVRECRFWEKPGATTSPSWADPASSDALGRALGGRTGTGHIRVDAF